VIAENNITLETYTGNFISNITNMVCWIGQSRTKHEIQCLGFGFARVTSDPVMSSKVYENQIVDISIIA